MSISKAEFWGNNYYNHPILTDEMVSRAEKELGVKLPLLLIELLKMQNGGYTKGFVFPMNEKTTWADDHVPLSDLFGIILDKNIRTAQNIMDTHYMTKEWGLPEKQVLLSGEGHWWITLDYRNNEIPTVKWFDVECEEEKLIANSFDDFINGLVSQDIYLNR